MTAESLTPERINWWLDYYLLQLGEAMRDEDMHAVGIYGKRVRVLRKLQKMDTL